MIEKRVARHIIERIITILGVRCVLHNMHAHKLNINAEKANFSFIKSVKFVSYA